MKKFVFALLTGLFVICIAIHGVLAADCSQCELTDKPTDGYFCYGRVSGTTCDDGLPILCQIDADCSGSNIVCSNSRCVDSSSLVYSCPENQYLENGQCFNCPPSAPYHDADNRGKDHCYTNCSAACDIATCANLDGGQLCDINKTCAGRMYNNGSNQCKSNISSCSCVLEGGDCAEYTCPDGYITVGGTNKYVDCKNGAAYHEIYCFKTCTPSASHGTVSTSSDNKAYYPKSCSYACASGYYGTATSATTGCTKCPPNATCAGGNKSIFKCNKNYFQNGTSCTACPSATDKNGNTLIGQTAAAGATSERMCYLTSGSTFSDATGDWEYGSNCYYSGQ